MRREAPQERWCPSEYSGRPLEHARCRSRSSSSGIGCSFRVSGTRRYRRTGWAIPLCRWPLRPAVWFSRPRAAPVRDHRTGAILSSSFASHSSFSWHNPEPRCRSSPAPLMGFGHPSAHARHRGPPAAPGAARRYVPPAGFGYPLDGFLPRGPGRLCFAPTALLGFALRSVTPREAPALFPAPLTHLPFLPSTTRSDRRRSTAVTPGRDSWALFLARPPTATAPFGNQPAAGNSRGLFPFQGTPGRRLRPEGHPLACFRPAYE